MRGASESKCKAHLEQRDDQRGAKVIALASESRVRQRDDREREVAGDHVGRLVGLLRERDAMTIGHTLLDNDQDLVLADLDLGAMAVAALALGHGALAIANGAPARPQREDAWMALALIAAAAAARARSYVVCIC